MESISWGRDALERIFWTVVQVVVAAALTAATDALLSTDTLDAGTAKAILLAVYAAGLAALKAWLATFVKGTISPASTAKAS